MYRHKMLIYRLRGASRPPKLRGVYKSLCIYLSTYKFLGYAAKHWKSHFNTARVTNDLLIQSALQVCDTRTSRFLIWFSVYECKDNNEDGGDEKDDDQGRKDKNEDDEDVNYDGEDEYDEDSSDENEVNESESVESEDDEDRCDDDDQKVDKTGDDDHEMNENFKAGLGFTNLIVVFHLGIGVLVQILDETDSDGLKNGICWNPLHWAISYGNADVVKRILAAEGVDLNAIDEGGRSPLCLAVRRGDTGIANLFLAAHGVDPNLITKDFF